MTTHAVVIAPGLFFPPTPGTERYAEFFASQAAFHKHDTKVLSNDHHLQGGAPFYGQLPLRFFIAKPQALRLGHQPSF